MSSFLSSSEYRQFFSRPPPPPQTDETKLNDEIVHDLVERILSQRIYSVNSPLFYSSPSSFSSSSSSSFLFNRPPVELSAFNDISIFESIKTKLMSSFTRKLSGSMMIFGENDEGLELVRRALRSFTSTPTTSSSGSGKGTDNGVNGNDWLQRVAVISGSRQNHSRIGLSNLAAMTAFESFKATAASTIGASSSSTTVNDHTLAPTTATNVSSSSSIKFGSQAATATVNATATGGGGIGNTQDHEALLAIANQLLLRRHTDKEVNAALEDLEIYFKQCRLDGVPAIIIIEDFHVFAFKKRQTLVYTLLDYMHKQEMLFMMIGITPRADTLMKLEKRVVSRLNAQYIYLPQITRKEICQFCVYYLTIRCNEREKVIMQYLQQQEHSDSTEIATTTKSRTKAKGRGRVKSATMTEYPPLPEELTKRMNEEQQEKEIKKEKIFLKYLREFREKVAEVFGKFRILKKPLDWEDHTTKEDELTEEDLADLQAVHMDDVELQKLRKQKEDERMSPQRKKSGATGEGEELIFCEYLHETSLSIDELMTLDHDSGLFNHSYIIEEEVTGLAASILDLHISWGRNRKYFRRLVQHILLKLDANPYWDDSTNNTPIGVVSRNLPCLTVSLVQQAIEDDEPRMLVQILSTLTPMELSLYSAIARLHCQTQSLSSSANDITTGNIREMTVDEVFTDFDKFTDAISKNVLTTRKVLHLLGNLINYGLISVYSHTYTSGTRGQGLRCYDMQNYVDPTTIIVAKHSAYEIISAYKLNHVDVSLKWRTPGSIPSLRIAERIRRAVLLPLEPLHYRLTPSVTNVSGMSGGGNSSVNRGLEAQVRNAGNDEMESTSNDTVGKEKAVVVEGDSMYGDGPMDVEEKENEMKDSVKNKKEIAKEKEKGTGKDIESVKEDEMETLRAKPRRSRTKLSSLSPSLSSPSPSTLSSSLTPSIPLQSLPSPLSLTPTNTPAVTAPATVGSSSGIVPTPSTATTIIAPTPSEPSPLVTVNDFFQSAGVSMTMNTPRTPGTSMLSVASPIPGTVIATPMPSTAETVNSGTRSRTGSSSSVKHASISLFQSVRDSPIVPNMSLASSSLDSYGVQSTTVPSPAASTGAASSITATTKHTVNTPIAVVPVVPSSSSSSKVIPVSTNSDKASSNVPQVLNAALAAAHSRAHAPTTFSTTHRGPILKSAVKRRGEATLEKNRQPLSTRPPLPPSSTAAINGTGVPMRPPLSLSRSASGNSIGIGGQSPIVRSSLPLSANSSPIGSAAPSPQPSEDSNA